MKYLEDILFGSGILMLGGGLWFYDWRIALIVIGIILISLPVAGMMKGQGNDNIKRS